MCTHRTQVFEFAHSSIFGAICFWKRFTFSRFTFSHSFLFSLGVLAWPNSRISVFSVYVRIRSQLEVKVRMRTGSSVQRSRQPHLVDVRDQQPRRARRSRDSVEQRAHASHAGHAGTILVSTYNCSRTLNVVSRVGVNVDLSHTLSCGSSVAVLFFGAKRRRREEKHSLSRCISSQ